ncbi:LysR family transcriptional regulator [Budviciaceae bacterium BWR-B9]|uniref:LysR family transcriptional regulator n=1 Tax=Limnobaculum allomyrinae TaxID=2791986 RepID=A0ABS1INS8_9GAMM|nr:MULTISPECIES: LysR family transcriptional regulator [Limnobaculum]MBK5143217.1 LysR family transcriptional regulator [Limnobaculum allomyrinae]MBV7691105.1 LysR family transcriptional regulator [Limnobaculum sp. M2-1]
MVFKQLQDMALFTLVVETGSFTAAAKRAGLPKSSVSQRISHLEQALGLRLLMRTTRQLSLTFAGERYLVHCQEMMQASERASQSLQMLRASPSGRIRITAPAGLAVTLLAPIVTDFQLRYPEVSIEVYVSDTVTDLVGAGFDLGIRTGKPQDSTLIGRFLGLYPRYLLASPQYLSQTEPVTHPNQLQHHRCITHRAWSECLLRKGDETYRWLQTAHHVTDNLLYARQCAIAGAGITFLPSFLATEVVKQGLLQPVLEEWRAEGNELYLVYPNRTLNMPALERFVEAVMTHPLVIEYAAGPKTKR